MNDKSEWILPFGKGGLKMKVVFLNFDSHSLYGEHIVFAVETLPPSFVLRFSQRHRIMRGIFSALIIEIYNLTSIMNMDGYFDMR